MSRAEGRGEEKEEGTWPAAAEIEFAVACVGPPSFLLNVVVWEEFRVLPLPPNLVWSICLAQCICTASEQFGASV